MISVSWTASIGHNRQMSVLSRLTNGDQQQTIQKTGHLALNSLHGLLFNTCGWVVSVLPVGGRSQPHFRYGRRGTQAGNGTQAPPPVPEMWFPPGADGENGHHPDPTPNANARPVCSYKKTGVRPLLRGRPPRRSARRAGENPTTHQPQQNGRPSPHPPHETDDATTLTTRHQEGSTTPKRDTRRTANI